MRIPPVGLRPLRSGAARAVEEIASGALLAHSGVIGFVPPHQVAALAFAVHKHGMLGGASTVAAIRYGNRTALIDELGSLTFRDLDKRSNALANAWRARGLKPGDGVAILARNHRGFLDAVFAAAKCGARIVLLNTDFAGPQIRDVAQREGTDLLVHDDEYSTLLEGIKPRLGQWRAWADDPGQDTLDWLIANHPSTSPPRAGTAAKLVLLTSGTTGTPKGAARPEPKSLVPIGGLLSKVPFRARETIECPAPLFHTFGFAGMLLGIGFGSTLVIRRRFDPAETLASLQRHRASTMIAVPVMLQRMVDLGEEAFAGKDFSSLRIIFVAGSQLGADLCRRVTAAFGPVVHNLYGSTEVAYATVATPEDLAVEPGCVGKPVLGAVVEILDERGRPVPQGQTGRIFVGNNIQFEGYTGGGGKEVIGGLMSSGDVGHFDSSGRLFIDGRDDDMIVSGGENVFPGEVEETLAAHPAVLEVAVLGVADETFGQRLRAFVVIREGATVTEDELRAHVREHLARYKVPREIVFIDELPRNPTGKVLKRQLALLTP